MPSYSAKLFCKLAKMADKWLKNEQKWRKNWNMWQKATKNSRKYIKIIEKLAKCCVFQIIHCQDFLFCPAKLPYLSCQASISVLPSTHFCPAKLTNLSRGGPRPPWPLPQLRLCQTRLYGHNTLPLGGGTVGTVSIC